MAQLCQNQNKLDELNTRVIIISFSTLPAIQEWLEQTCSNFTVLLDCERKVYKAYKLENSFWRAYHPKTLWFYTKVILSGGKMLDSHGDDTSQIGGDFIIDENGKFSFIYPSKNSSDRPPIEDLVGVLETIKHKSE